MILIISPKNVYSARRLVQEIGNLPARQSPVTGEIEKLEITIMSVEELMAVNFKVDIGKFDVLYVRNAYYKGTTKYFPQIIALAKKIRAAGKKVVDSTIAQGKLGEGKWKDYAVLKKADLPIPLTSLETKIRSHEKLFPVILKWTYGFKGKYVHLVENQMQYYRILAKYPKGELMRQEYIKADSEFEVYVVGFKAVPVFLSYKINNGFKANVKSFKIIKNSCDHGKYQKILKICEKAAKVLGRELCKIDMLEKDGKFYILEVNRNPGLVSFESLMGYNIAKDFVDYLLKIKPAKKPFGRVRHNVPKNGTLGGKGKI